SKKPGISRKIIAQTIEIRPQSRSSRTAVQQALIGIIQEIIEQLLKLQANPGNITFPGFFSLSWKRGETGENRVKITGLAARL
ncbi:MAG: hypothetical protein ACLVDZ_12745, partial [Ruminococcus sp.]